MTAAFTIESFEEYFQSVRKELPDGRKHFRGQTKLVSTVCSNAGGCCKEPV